MVWIQDLQVYFIIAMSINKIKLKQIDADFDALVGQYGSGYFLGKDESPTNVVFQSGNQSISGVKDFTSRPTISGDGVAITGECVLLNGDQAINGLKNFLARPLYNNQQIATFDKTVNVTGAQSVSGQKTFELVPFVGADPLALENKTALLTGNNTFAGSSLNTFYGTITFESNTFNSNYASVNYTYTDFLLDSYSALSLESAISASDKNLKTGISEIPDEWLEAWDAVNFCKFKFIDQVNSNSFEDASWHVGVIAQDIQDSFSGHGIDPFEVGVLCSGRRLENTPSGKFIKEFLSIRPNECQFLENALNRKKLNAILSGSL